MKKFIGIVLAGTMAVSLFGCTAVAPSESSAADTSADQSAETSAAAEGFTAEELKSEVIDFITDDHPGTAGYSVKLTEDAYTAFKFAYEHGIDKMDPEAVSGIVNEATANLTEEDKATLEENFAGIVTIIDDATSDSSKLNIFEDVGALSDMTELINNSAAKQAFDNLKDAFLGGQA